MTEKTSKLSPKDMAMMAARELYRTPLGMKVLTQWLIDMFFFEETSSPEQLVLKNFATNMMKDLGWNQGNAMLLTERILKLPKEKP